MNAIIVKSETDSRKWNAEIYENGEKIHTIVAVSRNTRDYMETTAKAWIAIASKITEEKTEAKKETKKEKVVKEKKVVLPRIAEDGSIRCTCCNEYFSASEFSKDSSNKHGFQNQTRAHIKRAKLAKQAVKSIEVK